MVTTNNLCNSSQLDLGYNCRKRYGGIMMKPSVSKIIYFLDNLVNLNIETKRLFLLKAQNPPTKPIYIPKNSSFRKQLYEKSKQKNTFVLECVFLPSNVLLSQGETPNYHRRRRA